MVVLTAKRAAAAHVQARHHISERRVCQVLTLSRSTKRRQTRKRRDAERIRRIHDLSAQYPRFGYRKIYWLLKHEGGGVGRERVRLIRKREGLQVLKKSKRRRPLANSLAKVTQAQYPGHVWSYDFISDQSTDGKRLRCLTILDEYTRYGLNIHCARSVTSGEVIQILDGLFMVYRPPRCIRSDNGPEFIAQALREWLAASHVGVHYIDPGSPWQNAYNESFNAVFRDGCLDRYLFADVREACQVIEAWLNEYHTERPHGALGGLTPAAYARRVRHQLAS